MIIFNEVVNILTICILAYTIMRIKKKNIQSKGATALIYTMSTFILLTVIDVINAFFIKNPNLDVAVVILKIPLVIILVLFFIRLRKKGSL